MGCGGTLDGWGCGGTLDGRGCSERQSTAWGLVLPDEEESELIKMLPFWPWAITGRGEYPRRAG